jgi:DNA polymerase-3 subunit delta'
MAQLLLCERAASEALTEPCGQCQQCRYAERGVHPDVHWFFPRPRSEKGDPSPDEVKADLAEAIAERLTPDGLWGPSLGSEGLHIATMRALVHQASVRPAMAARAVFVVGDAERMVSQEGADQAANTFLKLLEEPPPTATLILTTSEPGALLPTIRSRVVTIRVPPLAASEMHEFLNDDAVQRRLGQVTRDEALGRAAGAPGALLSGDSTTASFAAARRMLDAVLLPANPAGTAERIKVAAKHGVAGARGAYSDMLDALTVLLHARAKQLATAGHEADARRTSAALVDVENSKLRAQGNVSPQLLSAALIDSLHRTLVA